MARLKTILVVPWRPHRNHFRLSLGRRSHLKAHRGLIDQDESSQTQLATEHRQVVVYYPLRQQSLELLHLAMLWDTILETKQAFRSSLTKDITQTLSIKLWIRL
jgi:hypothetical protein